MHENNNTVQSSSFSSSIPYTLPNPNYSPSPTLCFPLVIIALAVVMGCATSKRYAEVCAESRVRRARILTLEEEIRETRRRRLEEARAHKMQLAALARGHEEVVGALEKNLAAEVGRRCALEAAPGAEGAKRELRWLGASRLAERVAKAEQARRDQAAERWKQLYLAIKAELDALIIRTKQGERLCWVSGEGVIGRLRRELKAKEEMVEGLTSRLEAAEKEKAERDRQIDILKQSLRILNSKKRRTSACRRELARILRPQR